MGADMKDEEHDNTIIDALGYYWMFHEDLKLVRLMGDSGGYHCESYEDAIMLLIVYGYLT
jgi:hypothetical protein